MENMNHQSLLGDQVNGLGEQERFEIGFKHKAIPNFKVGPFQFVKGILRIEADSQIELDRKTESFMELYRGLHGSDKAAIVKLLKIKNEERLDSVAAPSTVRGAVGTHQIADKETTLMPNAPAPASKVSGLFFGPKH